MTSGSKIYLTYPLIYNSYTTCSGTSMSVPLVAGSIALITIGIIRAIKPSLFPIVDIKFLF